MRFQKKILINLLGSLLNSIIILTPIHFFDTQKILAYGYRESKEERNKYNNLAIPNLKGEYNLRFTSIIGGKRQSFNGVYLRDGKLQVDDYTRICELLGDPTAPEGKQVVQIDIKLLTLLTGIQWWLEDNGYPSTLTMVSGYRSQLKNERVGGKSESYHLSGRAVDVRFDVPLDVVKKVANTFSVGGVGVYYDVKNKFIHLDTGPEMRRW